MLRTAAKIMGIGENKRKKNFITDLSRIKGLRR
jgi:hypothetical protein